MSAAKRGCPGSWLATQASNKPILIRLACKLLTCCWSKSICAKRLTIKVAAAAGESRLRDSRWSRAKSIVREVVAVEPFAPSATKRRAILVRKALISTVRPARTTLLLAPAKGATRCGSGTFVELESESISWVVCGPPAGGSGWAQTETAHRLQKQKPKKAVHRPPQNISAGRFLSKTRLLRAISFTGLPLMQLIATHGIILHNETTIFGTNTSKLMKLTTPSLLYIQCHLLPYKS